MSALTTGVLEHRGSETIDVRKRAPLSDGDHDPLGFRTVPDGTLTADIEVWIDWVAIIRQLGRRAMLSKGKKAEALRGAVVVRSRNARKVPE